MGVALLLVVGGLPARAQAVTPPSGAGGPTGNTDNAGGIATSPKPPGVTIAPCTKPSDPPKTAPKVVAVTVNPATRWQPRGGEVIVAITGDAVELATLTVRACFGWSTAPPDKIYTPLSLEDTFKYDAFTQVRPSERGGVVNIGVIVPWELDRASASFRRRWEGATRTFAFGSIPTASLRLIGYNEKGVVFDVVKPIGITTVWSASAFTIVLVFCMLLFLFRVSGGRLLSLDAGGRWPRVRAFVRMRWLLLLIRSDDGRASLSSFQMLLWTVVVVASAVYVMVLSGELINVPTGTLTLLGIAGAAKIIARTQEGSSVDVTRAPSWSDLVCPPNSTLADVARMQMLFFTLVSAGFVALQVVSSYVIPEIPAGYQILMGISNGVYVGAKVATPSATA